MRSRYKMLTLAGSMLAILAASPALAQSADAPPQVQGPGINPPAPPSANARGNTSSLRLGLGVSYSSGDYGEIDSTDVLAAPLSLTYRTGGLKVRVSVPFVSVRGPGSLLSTPEGRDAGGGGGQDSGGSDDNSGSGSGSSGSGDSGSGNSGSGSSGSGSSGSGSSGSGGIEVEDEDDDDIVTDDDVITGGGIAAVDNNRSGIGDVVVAMSYSLELLDGTFFEPLVKVKLPTASLARRLGSGEVDFTLGADLVQELGDATIYIGGFRKIAGQPAGSTIRSVWGASGGASFAAGGGLSIGADYSWQQSTFAGRPASSEVSAWINTRLAPMLSLTVYGGTGLNDNSADVFGGSSVSFRF